MWSYVWILYVIMVLVVFNSKKVIAAINFKRRIDFSKTLPGPRFKDLFSNASKEKILLFMKQNREKYGPVFRVWMGKDLFVFLADPDKVKKILSNNTLLHKSRNYDLIKPWLGKGLLTNSGESWHVRRKLLTPAFHFKVLSEFKQPMEENCKILMSKLDKHVGSDGFDVYPYLTLFALDVICETAMGIKKHAQVNSDSDYVKAIETVCKISQEQSFTWWQRIPLLFHFSSARKIRDKALKVLHGETKRVISLRRKILEEQNINTVADTEKDDEFGRKRHFAFLDMLLIAQKEGAPLTDQHIREEVDTFLFEGHDTTSSALGFAIYLLSQHPEVQQTAFEEAVQLEGKEKDSMKYMEAVIKESLRLYPSVPMFSRMLQEDFKLDEMTIPVGTAISVFCYMLHRDEKEFPEPEVFRPERHLENREQHPFAFSGFSAGPRNCIGQKFAMLELKCTLANLIRNFEILPVQGFEPKPMAELVLKSGNGIQIRLARRK